MSLACSKMLLKTSILSQHSAQQVDLKCPAFLSSKCIWEREKIFGTWTTKTTSFSQRVAKWHPHQRPIMEFPNIGLKAKQILQIIQAYLTAQEVTCNLGRLSFKGMAFMLLTKEKMGISSPLTMWTQTKPNQRDYPSNCSFRGCSFWLLLVFSPTATESGFKGDKKSQNCQRG